MLSAPVDAVPQGPRLAYEPKWDGFRAIGFVEAAGVYLQSRAGKNLTPYFPDITRAIRRTLPPGVILDGELIVWERGRTSFARLQRRITAGRGLLMMAREHPAHYVLWDLLADAGGQVVINAPLFERRARLAELLEAAPAQLTLTPQTTDMDEVGDWLTTYTAAGIEGVVVKRLDGRYEPGRRGWQKFRVRAATEAIVGGVTGSLANPSTLLLGRFDRRGHLRYTGRTHPLAMVQRRELAPLLSPLRPQQRRGIVAPHPWPQPLPASWSGQLDRPEPLRYLQVEPTVVTEIEVDTAFEHRRWRHRVWYVRPRLDLSVYDVPLLLGDEADPFWDAAAGA
ncbi:ATP-dependent DNA ligase [Micromonospora sp. MA102]|uniref:ATP-dependent DNA ligase n=1 Tax=Micromonospora sp. MA102 TaxID=2952755 RepID=UPI0021C62844|nr:ATP-dependent DNA ligase [Micromonospora sp. MA102]